MKTVSTLALSVALLLGAAAVATPAQAQSKKGKEAAQSAERKFKFSKEEQAALVPLDKAITAQDWAGAAAALPAAQAAAASPDAKYVLGAREYTLGVGTKNATQQIDGINHMVDSGLADAADLPKLYGALGGLYYDAKDFDRSATAFQKLSELTPNNAEVIVNIAKLRAMQKRDQEALPLLQRAIQVQTASGQPVQEEWYRLALNYAYKANDSAQVASISKQLITAYPTPTNWRDSLILYRDGSNLDKSATLDLMRLMRASKSLNGDRDWFDLADAANDAGLPGETKAVLDEAAASRAVDTSKPIFKDLSAVANGKIAGDRASLATLEKQAATAAQGRVASNTADAYLGYGDYAKAAALYRTALQKGSVDTNVVNTRLGIALAMSGQKADAEAAFKSVTGPRANLAQLWLIWLGQRA